MHRIRVIITHTFFDCIVQPIYPVLLTLGATILVVFAVLPFFTLGEDTLMYKSVALDVILLTVLLATLFATSKSIFEEIEDRTMLTLMSKPLRRWEVLIGKYLGIILSALLGVAALGGVLVLCLWLRIPGDYMLRTSTINEFELKQILDYRLMHIMGLLPTLVLTWFQVSVLAAIGVTLSTRFSLVVNLPTVILLYIAGNLMRFLFPLPAHTPAIATGAAWLLSLILPYLQIFDLRDLAIMQNVKVPGTAFMFDQRAVALSDLWEYVGIAAIFAFAYVTFVLTIGLRLLQTRELGGGEG
jgi:ABC-type transport system involved in multi-copper enzyme maturation permease subunit